MSVLGRSCIALVIAMSSFAAQAQEDGDSASVQEEVVVLGSRTNKPRSARDSTVPIDVISGEDFNNLGNAADLTDNLKNLVPSYTATPATGDGSAFIRPTSLRGTAPDQTLVLVGGKRRHRSALVQFFAPAAGNGAHGVDVGMLPGIAIKNVEVLRDGAAAQYGSDAIAGVINFALKDSSEGVDFQARYGRFYANETSYKIAGNGGFALGESGFVNISAEYLDNQALSRGLQRPNAQALIDAGVEGVGADTPYNDAPLVQTWGRPETRGYRLFLNSGISISDRADVYFHGNYSGTHSRYRFFYRNPSHSSLIPLRELGFTGLPAGYTPFFDGAQQDYSAVGGVKGEVGDEWFYDLSIGYGRNDLDYTLNNTVNPSLGLDSSSNIPQLNFNVGAYNQKEINVNADFSKALSDTINLAFGAEWREETYVVVPGETDASEGSGVSGFQTVTVEDSGSFARSNYAVYVDIEHEVTDRILLQYAGRYESFSDFGGTLNGKLAARYGVTDAINLRGAISTGFHAPTPGQANVRTTITTFDGATGLQVEEGLVPSTSPAAIAVGGTALRQETAVNYSLGFTMNIGENTDLTIDGYRINVNDRIYRTGDIPVQGSTTGATISFYTNALDVVHQGIDVVLSSDFDWSDQLSTDFSFALGYNVVDVVGQHNVGDIIPVSDANVEDIENNFPKLRFVLSSNTRFGNKWSFIARANYYGPHFDERGRIGADTNPTAEVNQIIYFDVELSYQVNESIQLALGGVNIFDSYINTIGPPNSNRLSVGLQYPRRTAANYEGGSWYAQARLRF